MSEVPLPPGQRPLVAAARRQFEALQTAPPLDPSTSEPLQARNGADPELNPDSLPGYRLVREIHRGGQGVVFEAVQKSTGRTVAVKVMREGPFAGPADLARFEREVQALAQLQHPHIVAIHDTGSAAGCHYFAMDYIRGRPLDAYMAGGTVDFRSTLGLFAKICEAVNAAHLRGIIHRDLKPGNVRVDASGEPHVLDFGLAKVRSQLSVVSCQSQAGSAHSRQQVPDNRQLTADNCYTETGQFIGSLPWASPEQADGAASKVDLRTDVYSLGVMLYQALTGRFPYNVVGPMREVLAQISHAEPIRPRLVRRDLDDEVETIVLKCLAKDRERRYQSAGDLARDIRHYLAGEPIEAKRDSAIYVLRKQLRRYRVPLAIAAAFALLIAASSVSGWMLYASAERERAVAVEKTRSESAARQEATTRLRESYLAQARAVRLSDQVGRRFDSLELVKKAMAIPAAGQTVEQAIGELRDEAIACLSLSDLKPQMLYPQFADPARPLTEQYSHIVYSSKPGLAAFCTNDGVLRVAAVPEGREVCSLAGPGLPVYKACFSENARFLAAKHGSGRPRVQIWDLESRSLLLSREVSEPLDFAFGPDEAWIALCVSSNNRANVEVHHLPSGKLWKSIPLDREYSDIAAHPSRPWIALLHSFKPGIRILDVNSESIIGCVTTRSPGEAGLAWTPDGRMLVRGGDDHRIYFYDAPEPNPVDPAPATTVAPERKVDEPAQPRLVLEGHQGQPVRLAFDAAGERLVSWGWDDTTRIWDLRTARPILAPVRGDHMAVRFDAVICSAGSTGLWRFEPAREYRQILAPERLGRLVEVRLNAEGRLAATYDPSAADLRIWDIQRGAQIGRLACHKPRRVQFLVDGGITAFTSRGLEHWMVECMGDEFRFSSAALVWPNSSQVPAMLLPDGQHVMMVTPDRGVRCIAIPNQTRPLTPYIAGGHALDNLDASPDGKWLFQGMWHGEAARIWNIQSAEPALEFSDLIYPGAVHINGFFTPDGRQLIVSDGRGFTWYEVGTWRKGRRLERAHGSGIAGTVAFAPRANLAALNAEPGRVRLLHADTGEPIATLTTPEELNAKLAFSRDGDTLVGATTERVIQVWNLALLRQRLTELGLNWESPHEVPPVTP